MKKITAIMAAMAALATPAMAHAATPDGDHVFQGSLEVRKALPLWTTCSVAATVRVTGGVPVLQSVAVSGGTICDGITFTGLPSAALDTTSAPLVRVPATVGVNIAFPAGSCAGSLTVVWGAGTPRSITFADGTSNIPGSGITLPCRIRGTLLQSSSPALNL